MTRTDCPDTCPDVRTDKPLSIRGLSGLLSAPADTAIAESHYLPDCRKPGRPADPALAIYRQMFRDTWSERTIARYVVCMRRLHAMGISWDDPRFLDIHRRCERPNRTLNVSRLDCITENMAAMFAARLTLGQSS